MRQWIWDTFFANRASAWTAAATVVLMIFSGLLWLVNQKANETNVATQRAFITFSGPGYAKDVNGKALRGVNVYYGMSNSGTTPAKGAVSQWNLSLGPAVPDSSINFDNLPQAGRITFVLGPKGAIQMKPVYLSVEDMDAVSQGKEHLFFWGWTTYRDIFSSTPKRLSEFCTELDSIVWTKPDHTDASTDISTVNPPAQHTIAMTRTARTTASVFNKPTLIRTSGRQTAHKQRL
jgi:hypothetical protein